MPNITKSIVDNAQSGPKDQFIWDDNLKGFGLKVTPAGKKVYIFQYRFEGRSRRMTIGQHGAVTPAEASKIAKSYLGQLAQDKDPAADRDKSKATPTVKTLAAKFDKDHISKKLKPKSAEDYRRIFAKHVLPKIGSRLISSIELKDIAELHGDMSDTPYIANRALAVLSKFFNWSERHGYRAQNTNPCKFVDKFKESARERYLSEDEIKRLIVVMDEQLRLSKINAYAIYAIKLLMLTGARKQEILCLKWEFVDFERRVLSLPDSKTGAKKVFLSGAVIELLREIPKQSDNPHIICGNLPGSHLNDIYKPWKAICNLAGVQNVRVHDLRHTFASVGISQGLSLEIIGALLGHSEPRTTARYAHLADDPLKEASERIGNGIKL